MDRCSGNVEFPLEGLANEFAECSKEKKDNPGYYSTRISRIDEMIVRAVDGDDYFLQQLTSLERQILKLILRGMTSGQISKRIGKTEDPLKYHRSRIMHKLNVCSTTELTKTVIEHCLSLQA